ncbi:MarR family winged helix-turn-helix transcriptional regulator [Streptomyces specialis]|uniref:MarR family winged helix-turn-helix transcriptional regulator n=1 Tax=Streptomyces specialis TaxID=498367 RepID=UPI00073F1521|nr:MarR family winged helix-turn-helix transcriptional regulator [Streptomyces specialis]
MPTTPSVPPERSVLDEVGPAISRLRRRTTSGPGGLTRNLVLNIVGDHDGEITVGALAAEMNVSQPVASRAAAAAIDDGLIRRAASQQDGRRTVLELTDAGEAERRRFAAAQRRVFEEITASWDPAERTRFARLLVRYSADSAAWAARQHS